MGQKWGIYEKNYGVLGGGVYEQSISPEFLECFLLRGRGGGGSRPVSQIFPFFLDIELCAQSLNTKL